MAKERFSEESEVLRGSLKTNLELLIENSVKRKNLTDRKRTEIGNCFSEAYQFFEELNFVKGVEILKKMETKFV